MINDKKITKPLKKSWAIDVLESAIDKEKKILAELKSETMRSISELHINELQEAIKILEK